jgi:hypothetical protein
MALTASGLRAIPKKSLTGITVSTAFGITGKVFSVKFLILLGVEFNRQERNIGRWVEESQ